MKKALSFLLALICLLTVIPPAAVSAATSGRYEYSVSNGKATITGLNSSQSGTEEIPASIDGYPVTAIGYQAFSRSISNSIVLPDTLIRIGGYAFQNCQSLRSITIPASLITVEANAFTNCTRLATVNLVDPDAWFNIRFYSESANPTYYTKALTYNGETITTMEVPNGVESIGEYQFYKNSALRTIVVPSSVKTIGYCAFDYCNGLTDVWYIGTPSQRDSISIGYYNSNFSNATWHYLDSACDTTCNNCNAVLDIPREHTYSDNCDTSCDNCGFARTPIHTFSNSCDEECDGCGEKRTVEHSFSKTCDEDCDLCGALRTTQHSYSGGVCTVCGKTYVSANGWVQENGIWVFYQNGSKLFNCWMEDSKGWCYLTRTGAMATNAWVPDSVGLCYVGPEGYCLTNQWFEDANGWVYLNSVGRKTVNAWIKDSKGWCYVGATGYMLYDQWLQDSKGWVYVDKSGYMVTNAWVKDSGGWCYVGKDGYCVKNCWMKDSKGWCWLTSSGRMATNQWIKDSKGWCYVDESGYCVTNCFKQDSTGWCYLDKEGSMVKNKWLQVGGKWYYMNKNGYRVTGWLQQGGKWYYMNTSGVMQTGWKRIGGKNYQLQSDGALKTNYTFGGEYVGSNGIAPNSAFNYLAAFDFRMIRQDFSAATPLGAYTISYMDDNGDFCVLTVVQYKIISTYSQVFLHNFDTGEYIEDPVNYYRKKADRAGTTNLALDYLDQARAAATATKDALTQGAYASASYLAS